MLLLRLLLWHGLTVDCGGCRRDANPGSGSISRVNVDQGCGQWLKYGGQAIGIVIRIVGGVGIVVCHFSIFTTRRVVGRSSVDEKIVQWWRSSF